MQAPARHERAIGGSPDLRLDKLAEPGRSAPPPLRGCCRDAPSPGPRLVLEVRKVHDVDGVHEVRDVEPGKTAKKGMD